MIYDGIHGYLSGALNQPNGTVLAMTKGPIKGRNFNNATNNPTYSITMSAGATGTVALQGTNTVALQDGGDPGVSIEKDILPTEAASWADIHAASASSASGTFSTEYEFIRLILVSTGVGHVKNAWVRWS